MKSTEQRRNPEAESLWTTSDVARFFGCSERQIYILRSQGLKSIHVGSMVRFDPAQVRLWVANQDNAGGNPDPRARQLADIAVTGDRDSAECAASDLFKEFPGKEGH
jgi:hypothetical protein